MTTSTTISPGEGQSIDIAFERLGREAKIPSLFPVSWQELTAGRALSQIEPPAGCLISLLAETGRDGQTPLDDQHPFGGKASFLSDDTTTSRIQTSIIGRGTINIAWRLTGLVDLFVCMRESASERARTRVCVSIVAVIVV